MEGLKWARATAATILGCIPKRRRRAGGQEGRRAVGGLFSCYSRMEPESGRLSQQIISWPETLRGVVSLHLGIEIYPAINDTTCVDSRSFSPGLTRILTACGRLAALDAAPCCSDLSSWPGPSPGLSGRCDEL